MKIRSFPVHLNFAERLKVPAHSCLYFGMLPVGMDSAVLVYSEFTGVFCENPLEALFVTFDFEHHSTSHLMPAAA
ncbi:hypothetical protein, partial [Klebsiella pneumoniae]